MDRDLERGDRKRLSLAVSNVGSKSPTTIRQERRLHQRSAELHLQEEEIEINNVFSCMGWKYDKRCLKFGMQCFLSVAMITLCSVKLLNNPNETELPIYTSLLSSTFTYWVNSPSVKEK